MLKAGPSVCQPRSTAKAQSAAAREGKTAKPTSFDGETLNFTKWRRSRLTPPWAHSREACCAHPGTRTASADRQRGPGVPAACAPRRSSRSSLSLNPAQAQLAGCRPSAPARARPLALRPGPGARFRRPGPLTARSGTLASSARKPTPRARLRARMWA